MYQVQRYHIDLSVVLDMLRTARSDGTAHPDLVLGYDNPQVDWDGFRGARVRQVPALPRGQAQDFIWRLQNGSALHGHDFPNRRQVRFHIDRFCPERTAGAHLVRDTWIGEGAGLGAAGAALAGFGPWGILAGAVLGGIGGGAVTVAQLHPFVVTHWDYRTGDWEIDSLRRIRARERRLAAQRRRLLT